MLEIAEEKEKKRVLIKAPFSIDNNKKILIIKYD